MKATPVAIGILALLVPFAADARMSATGASSVGFVASGPAGMRIVGSSSNVQVADDAQNITITVPLGELKTGIELRDHHMRDKYLEVGKYPNAELVVPRSAIRMPSASETSGDATGTMNLHGHTKSVSFHYVARPDGGVIHVGGTVHLNMHDFAIEVPSYLGVTVKPDVDVEVRFGAQR